MFGITAAGLVKWSYVLSLVAAALFVVAVGIFRAAMTAYTTPLLILLVATLIAFIALVMVLAGLVFGQFSSLNITRALIALVISAGIFVPIFLGGRAVANVPSINDIMTDTQNPPQFEVVPTVRKPFDNSLALSEDRLAYHRKMYGDMKPLQLADTPDAIFDKVLELVDDRGWLLVAADRAKGTVEATVATALFGFKDDVVIRLSAADNGTRVDMRSASRQGRTDFRVNSKRIMAFLEDLAD
jgi:uncharacterized protein (DUF1499 family)